MASVSKVAVITGGGSGIGRAAALALAREGYAVAISGRRIEALEETAARRQLDHGPILSVVADIADPGSVRELFRKAVDAFGRVDLLFNNAGVGAPPVELDEISFEQWKRVIDTNLTGAFLCTQEAFRQMKS